MVLLLAMSLLAAFAALAGSAPPSSNNRLEYGYIRSRCNRNLATVNRETCNYARYHVHLEPQKFKRTPLINEMHRSKRRVLPNNRILKGHHLFNKIHNMSISSRHSTHPSIMRKNPKFNLWNKLVNFKRSNFTNSANSIITENTNIVESKSKMETTRGLESTIDAEDLENEVTSPATEKTKVHTSNTHDETNQSTTIRTENIKSHAKTTVKNMTTIRGNTTISHANTKSHSDKTISDMTTAKVKIFDWLLHPHVARKHDNRYDIKKNYYMAVLVVADRSFVNFHRDKDYDTYILTVMNMAANYLHDVTLGVNIELVMVQTIYLEENREFGCDCRADCLLKKFCCWAQKVNPKDETHPHHHDVAILVTRKQIRPENGSCGLLGASYTGGACTAGRSCLIAEDTGLLLGVNIAHQLGHLMSFGCDCRSLGAQHDDGLESRCPPESAEKPTSAAVFRHVMAPTPRHGALVWSLCSRRSVAAFLSQGLGRCLHNEPPKAQLTFPEILPGVMYDADYQCHLRSLGASACYISPLDFCQKLFCRSEAAACTSSGDRPAQGTPCGVNKWCFNGACVQSGERPGAVAGGWGAWGGWGACSRSCGAGVQRSARACDAPPPGFGGRHCLGDAARFRTCNTQACHFKQASFRSTQCAEFDGVVIAGRRSRWRPLAARPSDRCGLYCREERGPEGARVRLRPRAADGTPCRSGARDMCVEGVCMILQGASRAYEMLGFPVGARKCEVQNGDDRWHIGRDTSEKVGCDWVIGSSASEDRCGVCGGDGLHCHLVEAWYNYTDIHQKGNKLITVIPKGSRKFRAYEAYSSENSFLVSNTAGLDEVEVFFLVGDKASGAQGEFVIDTVIGIYTHWQPGAEMILINGPLPFDIRLYVKLEGKLAPIHYSYMDVHLLEQHAERRSIQQPPTSTMKVPEVKRWMELDQTTVRIPEVTIGIDLTNRKSYMIQRVKRAVKPEETRNREPNLASIKIPLRINMTQEENNNYLLKETRMKVAASTKVEAQKRLQRNPFLERNNPFHWNRYQWEYLDWRPCSARCEVGTSFSMARCVSVWFGRVSDSYCDPARRPEPRVRVCNEHACLTRWRVGPWRKCHQSLQQRSVCCVRQSRSYSSAYTVVDGQHCRSVRPAAMRHCATGAPENSNLGESEIFELNKLQPVTEAATTHYYIAVLDPDKRSPFKTITCDLNATWKNIETVAPYKQLKALSAKFSSSENNSLAGKPKTLNRNRHETISPNTYKSSKNTIIVSNSVLYYQTKTTKKNVSSSIHNIKGDEYFEHGRTIVVTAKIPTTTQLANFNTNTETVESTSEFDVSTCSSEANVVKGTTSLTMADREEITNKLDLTEIDSIYLITKESTDSWINQETATLSPFQNKLLYTTERSLVLNYTDNKFITFDYLKYTGSEEYSVDDFFTNNDDSIKNENEKFVIRCDDGKILVANEVDEKHFTTESIMPDNLEMFSNVSQLSEVYTQSYPNIDRIISSVNRPILFKEKKKNKLSELMNTIFSKSRKKRDLKEIINNKLLKKYGHKKYNNISTFNEYNDSECESIKRDGQSLYLEHVKPIHSENGNHYVLCKTWNERGKPILLLKKEDSNTAYNRINCYMAFTNLNGSGLDASDDKSSAYLVVQLSKDNLIEINKLFKKSEEIKLVFKDDKLRDYLYYISNKMNTRNHISFYHPHKVDELVNKRNCNAGNEINIIKSTYIKDTYGNKIYDFDDLIKHKNTENEVKISRARATVNLYPNEFVTKIPLKIFKTIMSVDGTTLDIPDSQSIRNQELKLEWNLPTTEKGWLKPLYTVSGPRVEYTKASRITTQKVQHMSKIPDYFESYLKSISRNIIKKIEKPNSTICLNLKGAGVTIQSLYNIINIYCDSNRTSIIKDMESTSSFEPMDPFMDIKSSKQTIGDYLIDQKSKTLKEEGRTRNTKTLEDQNDKISVRHFRNTTLPSIKDFEIVDDKSNKRLTELSDGFIEITLKPQTTKKYIFRDQDKGKLSFLKKYKKLFKTKKKNYDTLFDGSELLEVKSQYKRDVSNSLKPKSIDDNNPLEKTTPIRMAQASKTSKLRSLWKRIQNASIKSKAIHAHLKLSRTVKDNIENNDNITSLGFPHTGGTNMPHVLGLATPPEKSNTKHNPTQPDDNITSPGFPYTTGTYMPHVLGLATPPEESNTIHNPTQPVEESIQDSSAEFEITTDQRNVPNIKIVKDFIALNNRMYERVEIVGINEFKKSLSDAADRENGDEIPTLHTGPKKFIHGSNAHQLSMQYYNQSFDVY